MAYQTMPAGMKFSITGTQNSHGLMVYLPQVYLEAPELKTDVIKTLDAYIYA